MIYLQTESICKSFLGKKVLKNINFKIKKSQKIALVGINGSGKTTLLNIISKKISPDSGRIHYLKDIKIGILEQIYKNNEYSIYEYARKSRPLSFNLEKKLRSLEVEISSDPNNNNLLNKYQNTINKYEDINGYAAESIIKGILIGLGFSELDFNKKISTLSGGERTRLELAFLLSKENDLIILDEPTNHLDMKALIWLEKYISNSNLSYIIVSHDRMFIDNSCNSIYDIHAGRGYQYNTNYTSFLEEKKKLIQSEKSSDIRLKNQLKSEEEKLRTFKQRALINSKFASRARDREKKIEKLKKDKEDNISTHDYKAMNLKFKNSITSPEDIIDLIDISKSFGKTNLFNNISISVKKGDILAIVGDNGTGKTTLLKIITEDIMPDTGLVNYGRNIKISYYDQKLIFENENNNLIDEINNCFSHLDNRMIRNLLAQYLFTGDDAFKRISDLSGGEKARLSLLKLMLKKSNLLILDEPTNHLDYLGKQALEEALLNYEGTIILVSHDRYLLKKLANSFLFLGKEPLYIRDDYSIFEKYYIDSNNVSIKKNTKNKKNLINKKNKTKINYEEKILKYEEKLEKVNNKLLVESNNNDYEKLLNLTNQINDIELRINELYIKWEEESN